MLEDTKRARAGTRTTTLKAVPFFTQLDDRELDAVRALATEKNYPKNAVVLTEGEMGDSLYMIQSGKVKVFIGDEEGRDEDCRCDQARDPQDDDAGQADDESPPELVDLVLAEVREQGGEDRGLGHVLVRVRGVLPRERHMHRAKRRDRRPRVARRVSARP